MLRIIVAILFVYFPSLVVADELKTFKFDMPSKLEQKGSYRTKCEFENLQVPENAVVYAAGAYSGREIEFQIDQSGHTATQFDIGVNSPSKPVILMLGAYEPTIWNLGWTKETQILAVLASGYHRQVVAGLSSDVPVLISTYDNRGPCGYFNVSKGRNTALNPKSRALFGKPVDMVFVGGKSGTIVVGDPIERGTKFLTSSANPPDSYYDREAPLAGQAGLEEAVSKGLIRPATIADANRWVEALAANTPQPDVPPIAGQGMPKPRRPRVYNAYVVLKKFRYPAGLYGANSATFFIEKGVPNPSGTRGHSSVYDFNTLTCRGVGCGRLEG